MKVGSFSLLTCCTPLPSLPPSPLSLFPPTRPLRMDRNYDCLLKVLLCGDSGVGKTCLISQFTDGQVRRTHITTIGELKAASLPASCFLHLLPSIFSPSPSPSLSLSLSLPPPPPVVLPLFSFLLSCSKEGSQIEEKGSMLCVFSLW